MKKWWFMCKDEGKGRGAKGKEQKARQPLASLRCQQPQNITAMKKTSCFLLLAAWVGLGLAPLSAQTSFGLHGGMNYGTVRYDNLPFQFEEKYDPGYFVGTSILRQLPKRFALGLDAQFGLKASRLESTNLPSNLDPRYRNYYLEVAPRAEYFLTKNFGISLGFYTAYLTKQRAKFGDEGDWGDVIKNFYSNRWDVGLTPGISLRFGRAFGFMRYTHSLAVLDRIEFTDDQGQPLGVAKLYNRYFQAGIGYVIFE